MVAAQNTGKRIATVMKQLKSGANPQQKLAFNKIQGEVDDLVASTKGMRSPTTQLKKAILFLVDKITEKLFYLWTKLYLVILL